MKINNQSQLIFLMNRTKLVFLCEMVDEKFFSIIPTHMDQWVWNNWKTYQFSVKIRNQYIHPISFSQFLKFNAFNFMQSLCEYDYAWKFMYEFLTVCVCVCVCKTQTWYNSMSWWDSVYFKISVMSTQCLLMRIGQKRLRILICFTMYRGS